MESPTLVLLGPGPQHWATLKGLLAGGRVLGGAIHDARIAALCLEQKVSALWSADRDFSRFERLRVENPLAG